jgi:nucleotide-binding universal stress UspA family protein
MSDALDGSVVTGVDGRPEGFDALALGQRLAAATGRRLLAVAAYPFAPLSSRALDGLTDAGGARRVLETVRYVVGPEGAELLAVPGSSPGRTLHEVAEAHDAALIVVGSSHQGPPGRLVLGAVTAETLRRAPCAVAVAPRGWADGPRALTHIGVAVDGSARDRSAIAFAAALADGLQPAGAVETVHVEPVIRGRGASHVEAGTMLAGDPTDVLAAHSATLDLLVLGSRGRLGSVVLGSLAARLVGIARCPVVALPSEPSTTEADGAAANGVAAGA